MIYYSFKRTLSDIRLIVLAAFFLQGASVCPKEKNAGGRNMQNDSLLIVTYSDKSFEPLSADSFVAAFADIVQFGGVYQLIQIGRAHV